jgi:hypothetical protein
VFIVVLHCPELLVFPPNELNAISLSFPSTIVTRTPDMRVLPLDLTVTVIRLVSPDVMLDGTPLTEKAPKTYPTVSVVEPFTEGLLTTVAVTEGLEIVLGLGVPLY